MTCVGLKLNILDNPIWNALTTKHSYFAEGDELARRYPVEVTALGALNQPTPEAFESLAHITGGDVVALFSYRPVKIPEKWKTIHTSNLVQMVCESPKLVRDENTPLIEELTAADTDDMIALTRLTNPGPFGKRTQELGLYLGIHQDGRRPPRRASGSSRRAPGAAPRRRAPRARRVSGRRTPAPPRIHRGERRLHPSRFSRARVCTDFNVDSDA